MVKLLTWRLHYLMHFDSVLWTRAVRVYMEGYLIKVHATLWYDEELQREVLSLKNRTPFGE